MSEFEMNCWVTVVACAGCSCVSPCTSVILVLLAALSIDTASSAKCNCSVPSGATGPVIGPSNPIAAVHDLVLALLGPPPAPPLLELLRLLLLQPATTSEPTAAATRTRRPFIGIRLHFPGYLTMWVGGRISEGSCASACVRGSSKKRPPPGRIRNADQTIAV